MIMNTVIHESHDYENRDHRNCDHRNCGHENPDDVEVDHRKHCRGSVRCHLSSREGSTSPHSSRTLDPLQVAVSEFSHFGFLSELAEVVCQWVASGKYQTEAPEAEWLRMVSSPPERKKVAVTRKRKKSRRHQKKENIGNPVKKKLDFEAAGEIGRR